MCLFDGQDMEPKRPRFDPPYQHILCGLCVATLALGLQPRQGLARLRAKREAR